MSAAMPEDFGAGKFWWQMAASMLDSAVSARVEIYKALVQDAFHKRGNSPKISAWHSL